MFNVGGGELLVIVLLALIVLGPDKLPGAMRTLGGWIGEMRKIASGFQAEMHKAVDQATSAASPDPTAADSRPPKAGDATPSRPTSNGSGDGNGDAAGANGSSATPTVDEPADG